MEGGRVSHQLVHVCCHGYGGLWKKGVDGDDAGQCEGLVECRQTSKLFPSARRYTDDTRSHRFPGTLLWVGSTQYWSVFLGTSDATRRLRTVVHAAG